MGRRAWVGIVLLVACEEGNGGSTFSNDDEAWAQWMAQICQQQASCSCMDALGPQECRDALELSTDELRSFADELGLTFDGVCFQELIDRTRALECATIQDIIAMSTSGGGGAICKLYYGRKRVGEACETVYAYDECQQGLFCLEDTCVDWSGSAQEGEPCYTADAEGPCAAGLICRISSDGNGNTTSECIRPARVGESCAGSACEFGLVCDTAQDACRVAPGVGEPCFQGQCDGASRCDDTTQMCIDRLAAGAMCTSDSDCSSDQCGDMDVCEPLEPWVCEISQSLGEIPQDTSG